MSRDATKRRARGGAAGRVTRRAEPERHLHGRMTHCVFCGPTKSSACERPSVPGEPEARGQARSLKLIACAQRATSTEGSSPQPPPGVSPLELRGTAEVPAGLALWCRCVILKNGEGGQVLQRPDRPVSSGYFFSNTLAKMAKSNTTTAKSRSSIRLTSFLGSGETTEGPVFPHRALGFPDVPAWKLSLLCPSSAAAGGG